MIRRERGDGMRWGVDPCHSVRNGNVRYVRVRNISWAVVNVGQVGRISGLVVGRVPMFGWDIMSGIRLRDMVG